MSCKLLTFCLFAFISKDMAAQTMERSWTFHTEEKIVAGPISDGNNIYVGNEDGRFYALRGAAGDLVWEFDTGGNIQAKAVLHKDKIILESANIYYALDKTDGRLIWKRDLDIAPEGFSFKTVRYHYKLDFFDDKRASGIVHEHLIYFGTSNGKLLGLDLESGEVVSSFSTDLDAPVRSTPFIQNELLFFGDWNGVIYCYDLNKNALLWKKRTYREKPYDTFGGIASEFTTHNGMLFFGARNPMMNVLWKEDGQKEWTYTDSEGGWMIGDPVIFSDTLYIGGSDNLAMFAFNANDGKLIWKNKGTKNIYTKPIVTRDWIIYTGGNSYNPRDTGEIVLVDRKTGRTLTTYQTSSNAFSSPLLFKDSLVVFGTNDGTVYALKIKQ